MAFARRVITKTLDLLNLQRHNDNFADIETDLTNHNGRIATAQSDITTHKESTQAHAAEHIAYSGSVAGSDNVKEAIELVDDRLSTIIVGGSEEKDPELTDIKTPDPSYTPGRTIAAAGDLVRDMQKQFGEQLAEKLNAIYIATKEGFEKAPRYGYIRLPVDFYPTSVKLFRGPNGVYHSFNTDLYTKGAFDETLYFDTGAGNDTSGTGAESTPYKTLYKCFEHIKASSNARFKVVGAGQLFREEVVSGVTGTGEFHELVNKTVVLTTKNGAEVIMSNAQSCVRTTGWNPSSLNPILAWTHTGSYYQANRSAVYNVVDLRNKDFNGVAIPLDRVATIAELVPNTWYSDGTIVCVRTFDDRPIDDNLLVCLGVSSLTLKLTNSTFYMENYSLYVGGNRAGGGGGTNYDGVAWITTNDLTSKVIINNCKFCGGNITNRSGGYAFTNALAIKNVKETYVLNSICAYTLRDGFNYHYADVDPAQRRNCFVFEYRCIGYQCGVNDTNSNNNATTAHESVNILRVECVGTTTRGPICADVNGCYTVIVDCNMEDSLIASGVQSASYYFDNTSAPAGITGKAVIINSNGNSPTYSISGGSGFNVTIDGFFNYKKIYGSLNVTVA